MTPPLKNPGYAPALKLQLNDSLTGRFYSAPRQPGCRKHGLLFISASPDDVVLARQERVTNPLRTPAWVVCYTAVFSVVTQRSSPQGALFDDAETAVKQTTSWEASFISS